MNDLERLLEATITSVTTVRHSADEPVKRLMLAFRGKDGIVFYAHIEAEGWGDCGCGSLGEIDVTFTETGDLD